MRKKTISFGLDNILWYMVYLLPILCFLVYLSVSSAPIAFETFMTDILGFSMVLDNPFISTVSAVFGSNGILPLFDTSSSLGIILYLSYFVGAYFVHFLVDITMLLPRMLMKALDKLGGDC